MPTPLTPQTLERVLQGLYDSEIRCGIQNEPPAGGITAWIDYGSRYREGDILRHRRGRSAGLACDRHRCLDA